MWPVRRPARSHTLCTHQTLAALRIATLGPLSLHELFLKCASPVSAPTGLKSTASRRSSAPSTPRPTPLAAPVPTTSCPTSWFRAPLDKAIQKLVRPSTARTRRKELVIKTSLPLEVFEDFMSPLSSGDAEGLTRDSDNRLVPTSTTTSVRHYKYLVKKGSVSDRLFHLQTLDPEPKEPSRAHLNLFKHLFRYTIHEGLPDTKKQVVRDYCKAAGFYSYDAASVDEDPVKHWIGREVKRFIEESHLHLPFLLQLAAAPADCVPEMAAMANAEGEQEMEHDDEYAPSAEDIAQEEQEEPLMMRNADRWDRFLSLVRLLQRPWPQGAADTDFLRKERAVEVFNLGARVANDLLALKPTMQTWVPHILVFIVPRQMVLLGDPTRRSCDACESFGAMVKKLIKHTTCRRRVCGAQQTLHVSSTDSTKRWQQTFNRGYIEQAFRRVTVRESLQHGPENAPFLQRADACRTAQGKTTSYKKPKINLTTPRTIREFVNELPEQRRAAEPSVGAHSR